jgi:Zn-dependent peptidase ImmA (M78 family)
MTLVRGFKTECERTVTTLREELSIDDDEPIDMNEAAEHLCIPVKPLARILTSAGQHRSDPFVDEIYRKVSAFTVFKGWRRAIVYNDEHAPTRHRSNLAHELAHALLQHPPRDSGLAPEHEERHEAEAAWMGGVMMLTAAQARSIVARGMSRTTAEVRYQLSPEMLRFRLNVTGAARLASRAT